MVLLPCSVLTLTVTVVLSPFSACLLHWSMNVHSVAGVFLYCCESFLGIGKKNMVNVDWYILNKTVSEQVFCTGSSVEHTLRVIRETLHNESLLLYSFPLTSQSLLKCCNDTSWSTCLFTRDNPQHFETHFRRDYELTMRAIFFIVTPIWSCRILLYPTGCWMY